MKFPYGYGISLQEFYATCVVATDIDEIVTKLNVRATRPITKQYVTQRIHSLRKKGFLLSHLVSRPTADELNALLVENEQPN